MSRAADANTKTQGDPNFASDLVRLKFLATLPIFFISAVLMVPFSNHKSYLRNDDTSSQSLAASHGEAPSTALV